MPTVDIKRAGTDLQRRIAPNNQQFVQTEDISYLEDVQQQTQRWKQAEDATYVANATTELQKQVYETGERLKQDFFDNPEGYSAAYEQATQALYKQTVDNAPSAEARNSATQVAESIKRSQFNQAVSWEQTNTVARYQERHDEAISSLSNILADNPTPQNYQDVMAQVQLQNYSAEKFLSPEEHIKLVNRNEMTMAETLVKGVADRSPAAAKELLESGQFDETFDARNQTILNNYIDAQAKKMEAESARREKQAYQNRVDNYKKSIFSAGSSYEIDQLEDQITKDIETGKLDIDHGLSVLSFAGKMADQKFESQNNIALVQNAIATGTPIKDDKALDAYYQWYQSTELADVEDLGQKAQLAAEHMLSSTGQLPKALRTGLKNQLFSSNHNIAASAAVTIRNAVPQHPYAAKNFSDEEIAMAYDIATQVEAGVKPEQAVNIVQKKQVSQNIPQDQARNKQFTNSLGEVNALIEEEFGDIEVPARQLHFIHERARENNVIRKIDLVPSVQAAITQSKKLWSSTNIRGKEESMYMAPELEYGAPGADDLWANEQMVEQLGDFLGREVKSVATQQGKFVGVGTRTKAIDDPRLDKLLDNVVSIQPTQVDGKAGYVPLFQDENGRFGPYVETNPESENYMKPFTYFPDFDKTDPGQAIIKQKEEDAEALRIERAKRDQRLKLWKELQEKRGDKPMTDAARRAAEGQILDRIERMEDRGEL